MTENEIKATVVKYCQDHGYERMNLQAAMFDMDGVLFDSMKNHAYCWHRTMAHYGFDLPEWEAYMHEGRTGASTINIVSRRERGHDATEEEIREIYQYKSDMFSTCPTAERMPGAYELLRQVKADGITPIIVTGSGQVSLLERLNNNFPDIFTPELMVTAFDVKRGKPDPEPYLMGMEKYNNLSHCDGGQRAVERCFIVVENAPLGVQAGVAAGVFTIAVNTGPLPDSALLDQGANLLFHSMQELCDNWPMVLKTMTRMYTREKTTPHDIYNCI